MGYYQGDFYAGYRGDPGFWSGLLSAGKKAAGMALSVIPGGSAISAAGSMIPRRVMSAVVKAREITSPLAKKGLAVVSKHPVLTAAGAAGALTAAGAAAKMGSRAGAGMGAMPGVARAGGYRPSKRHLHALEMGLTRARPRMNVCNVHALRRALRRAKGFEHIARRVLHFTSPRRARGSAHFRFKRRKRA
jgi:hypothetical protein